MNARDCEVLFRVALCRLKLSLDDIKRLFAALYSDELEEAECSLKDAIMFLERAQTQAAEELGFEVGESMLT